MTVPPFLFVRHGETDWNVEGRLQGRTDIPLNGRGRHQARLVGERLAAWRGEPPTRCAVSPLGRARETAEAVRTAMRIDPHDYTLDDRLMEFSFGTWEGLTWPEIKAKDPQRLRARRQDKWNFVPPGGESYAMLAERVRPWLEEVQENMVAVSHGGVARVLMVLIGGLSPLAAPNTEVPQGRVLRFAARGYAWL